MPATTVTIGRFARLSHLTVKTLHHYHEVGLLAPAHVDPTSGYRYYALDQLADAALVRGLRDTGMPVPEVRAVLGADGAARDALLVAHLERLRADLARTSASVASLAALLAGGPDRVAVTHRLEPERPCLMLRAHVTRDGLAAWCGEAFGRLHAATVPHGGPAGPAAGLYDDTWFADGEGEVTALVPVLDPDRAAPCPDGVTLATLPAARLAVALHHGDYATLATTYGALGRHVLEAGAGADGPVRETYLVSRADTADADRWRTEVAWPVLGR